MAAAEALGHLEDPARDELPPIAAEQRRVVAQDVVEVAERALHEQQHEERAVAARQHRHAGLLADPGQALAHALAESVDALVHRIALEMAKRRERGLDADGAAVERAAEVHVPVRRRVEALHVDATAGHRGERIAVCDRLAERGEVRRDAEDRLRPAEVMADARDHLVEDQQRALAVAERAHALEEARHGQDAGRVVADRLEDDGRDLLGVRGERALDVLEVVEAAHGRRVDRGPQHPRRARAADHRPHEDAVVEAVVEPLELDDPFAAGDAAGQADRVVGRLRAAPADDDLLGARDVPGERLGELHLRLGDADPE